MLVADKILSFYQSLQPPALLPEGIECLNPYQDIHSWELTNQFYRKYFSDQNERKILFGINPGRFGGGLTGIPFTDPIELAQSCGITNDLHKRAELSSKFIYEMIHSFGGPEKFYQHYFISAVSPIGFMQSGKNLNYYDITDWESIFTDYVVSLLKEQMAMGINQKEVFCIGQGQNVKFIEKINRTHHLFEKITALPHPRWIMQYRLKTKNEHIAAYLEKI